MQLAGAKTVLLKNLEQALGVIERKSAMPILTHCLLEANGQGLVISATDLELSYQGVAPAAVRDPGACTVLAHSLHTLVKSLPPGEVELAGSDGTLTLSTGESHYQLLTRDPEEFPALRLTGENGKYQEVPCPCERIDPYYQCQDPCKILGTLQVLIEGTDRIGGVWKFRTTSRNTVNAILSSLALIKTITGGPLAGIPLHLVLAPKTVTVPTTGQNLVVYVVSLEYRGTDEARDRGR